MLSYVPCLQGSKKQSKVAVGQMTSISDRDANFLTCQRLAKVMPVIIESPCLVGQSIPEAGIAVSYMSDVLAI